MGNASILINDLFDQNKENDFNQFLHSCIDEICGYPGPTYKKFQNTLDWPENAYQIVYELVTGIFKNPTSLYLDEDKMPVEYYEFPVNAQQSIMTCLKIRQENLCDAVLREVSKNENWTLKDFNWKLKYIVGSSKMASLREPLLQLNLSTEKKKRKDNIFLELNKTELHMLISSLETIAQ